MSGTKQMSQFFETRSSLSTNISEDAADIEFYKEFIKESLFRSASVTNAVVR